MKKSNEKLLASAIAGLTAIQGVNTTLLNVSAKDYEITGTSVSYVTKEKSQKDQLESNLCESKNKLDENKVQVEISQNEVGQAKENLDRVQVNYENQQILTNQMYQNTHDSVMSQLQPLLDEIDGLETQIKEAKTDLDAKISASQKAASDLEEMKTTLGEKKGTLKELQTKLETLKNAHDEFEKATNEKMLAEASVGEAQKKVDVASNDLQEVSKYVNEQKALLDQATKDYNAALADASNKQAILNEKQELVDSFNNESEKAELEQAKADLDVSNEKLNQATNDYNNALATQQKLQQEYDAACIELNNANASLSQTQATLDQVQKESTESQSKLDEKNKEIAVLNTEIENVQADVNKAQSDYDKALNDYNSVITPLEQAKKELSQFEAEHETQLNQLSLGIQGYYDSMGAFAASDILKDPRGKLAGHTHIGAENDATSLDNVINSISYLKEFNKIRASENLPELKVSMVLMAISQANANWQRDEAQIGNVAHASVYSTGENAAWGYGDAETKTSPFTAWYNLEKAWYSNGITDWHKIGHYKNIVSQGYDYTGYAHIEEGAYGSTDIQEFDHTYGEEGTASENDRIMSVEEFEKSLNQYVSNLKDVDTKHKTLLDAVKNATGMKDDTLLKQTEALLSSKKGVLSNLQAQWTHSNNDRDALMQVANEKKTAAAQLKDSVKNQSQIVKQKEGVKTDKEVELKESKVNVETSERNCSNAQSDRDALQSKIKALIDKLDHWDTRKQEAKDALSLSKTEYQKAQVLENETKERLNDTRDAYTKAVYKKSLVQQDLDSKTHVLNQAQTTLKDKTAYYNEVKKASDAYTMASHDLDVVNQEIKDVSTRMDVLRDNKKELESKIQLLSKSITALNENLAKNESAALPYQNLLHVLNDVKKNGSRVNLPDIEDVSLKNQILELAKNVDALNVVQNELGQVKQEYVNKYNAYLDVKTEKLNAQTKYDNAMEELNTYLSKTPESIQKDTVNTGIETGVVDAMLMSCLAGLGIVGVLQQKRREEK